MWFDKIIKRDVFLYSQQNDLDTWKTYCFKTKTVIGHNTLNSTW